MKNLIILIFVALLITGCSAPSKSPTPTFAPLAATEVPCPGVEPKGVSSGMEAYFSISGANWSSPVLQKPSRESSSTGDLFHHVRVKLVEGPVCDQNSAWWQISSSNGLTGWVQIGSDLKFWEEVSTAAFLPFTGDAVQRDVPEERSQEAQVRYILADIELGGDDVLKYYQDQIAAKPDDTEMEPIRIALKIIQEFGESHILANPQAFERKPFRGGTSVLDAGTEFVQPGLDILLKPCDLSDPKVAACKEMSKE